jgi:hypothetical protein
MISNRIKSILISNLIKTCLFSGRARQSKQELMDMLWDAGTCDKFFQSYYKWREPLCSGADPALLTLWGAYFVAALASVYFPTFCTTIVCLGIQASFC